MTRLKMRLYRMLILSGLLALHGAAQASYVFSCVLDGVVASAPQRLRLYANDPARGGEVEREEMRFDFQVDGAKPGSRADSDCRQEFLHKKIAMHLDVLQTQGRVIERNARLRIHYIKKEYDSAPSWESFSLP